MARLPAVSDRQLRFAVAEPPREPSVNLTEAFRRLYYDLYTNSDATRAESIVEDLSLVLLLKLAVERSGAAPNLISAFCDRGGSVTPLLVFLRREFPDLVADDRRFKIGDESLRRAFGQLRSIDLTNAPGHALGEAFQALIGPRLRGDRGQFFTPRSLVTAMVQIVSPEPGETVLDPACGTGGFLVEAAVYQAAANGRPRGRVVGSEKDNDLSGLAAALLQITAGSRATVRHANSLDLAAWGAPDDGEPEERFDVILTNPPFGAKIGVKDESVLRRYHFGHRWVLSHGSWTQTDSILANQDPQVLFLELCVRLLRPGGRLGIVLPEGVFGNKGDGYVWQWLAMQGRISALLDCPRTTFQPSTDTKTNALFFERAKRIAAVVPARVKIGVALSCGHDRRGRSRLGNGAPHPDDFLELGMSYASPKSRWREVELTRSDYLVPRYYAEQRPLTPQEADLTHGASLRSLGELVASKMLTVRKGHEVGSDAYGTGDVPFVRTSDVSNFEISADPTKAVGEDVYVRYSKQQRVKAGDVLMVVDGRYRIGATAMLTEHNCRCVVQSHFRIIGTPRPDYIDPYELLYALNLPSVRLRIRDLVFIQSTLGTLGKRLLELKIPVLHGPGTWRGHVDRFRALLQARDRLLGELATQAGPDFEL